MVGYLFLFVFCCCFCVYVFVFVVVCLFGVFFVFLCVLVSRERFKCINDINVGKIDVPLISILVFGRHLVSCIIQLE